MVEAAIGDEYERVIAPVDPAAVIVKLPTESSTDPEAWTCWLLPPEKLTPTPWATPLESIRPG